MILNFFLNTQIIWIIFKNIEEYNSKKKGRNIFEDVIFDILANKKLNPVVTELFIIGRKLNISVVFITKYYFAVPRNIRLNSKCYFLTKIPNKKELQQIAFNHLAEIDVKDFMNLGKNLLQNHTLF